jgi:hypothetical protein
MGAGWRSLETKLHTEAIGERRSEWWRVNGALHAPYGDSRPAALPSSGLGERP